MDELKPLIFKSNGEYYSYIVSKEDGVYSNIVIYNFEENTRIFFDYIIVQNNRIVYAIWKWDITLYKKKDSCKFVFYINDSPAKPDFFYETLKEKYPDHFSWLLFNPEWWINNV